MLLHVHDLGLQSDTLVIHRCNNTDKPVHPAESSKSVVLLSESALISVTSHRWIIWSNKSELFIQIKETNTNNVTRNIK